MRPRVVRITPGLVESFEFAIFGDVVTLFSRVVCYESKRDSEMILCRCNCVIFVKVILTHGNHDIGLTVILHHLVLEDGKGDEREEHQ